MCVLAQLPRLCHLNSYLYIALYAGSCLDGAAVVSRGRGAHDLSWAGGATISWAGPRVISWAGSHAPSCVDSYRTNQPYVLRGVVIALDVNNALSTLESGLCSSKSRLHSRLPNRAAAFHPHNPSGCEVHTPMASLEGKGPTPWSSPRTVPARDSRASYSRGIGVRLGCRNSKVVFNKRYHLIS